MARPYSKKSGSFHGRGGGGRGGGGNSNSSSNGGNAPSNFNGGGRGGRGGGGGGGGSGRGGRGNFNHQRGSYQGRNGNNNNNNNRNGGNDNNGGSIGGADVMKVLLSLLFEKSGGLVFNAENGMLTLSNMRASADLESVQKRVDFNSVAFCKVLAEVLREKFADRIRVLQLDDDSIRQFKVILTALADADIHRGVTAISAMNNSIADLSFIGALKRYDGLGELLLTGNAVASQGDYRPQLTRQLPRLTMIDGAPVDRPLLSLPNPVGVNAGEMQLQVAMFLEQYFFAPMTRGNFDATASCYNPQFAALSLSRGQEPLPQRVPKSAIANTADLERHSQNQMQADLSKLRSGMEFRNLATDSAGSMRNVAKGTQEITAKLRHLCGAGTAMSVEVEFNPNFNVVFMGPEYHMRVPVCVVTVHGKLRYQWNPIQPDTQRPIFPANKAPTISTFFDRTMSLTWNESTSTYVIANDMLLLRPDRTVVHDDGTPSSPLFFANTPPRIEQMRRRLMPGVTTEVMSALVTATFNDADVKEAIRRLLQLPPEQLQAISGDPQAAKAALGL